MRRFISFSGGVESSTLALMYGHVATPIFADTGYEHQELYDRLDRVEEALKIKHGDDFEIIRLKRQHETQANTLPEYIEENKFYPSFRQRYCTRMFKIEPIDDFLRQFEDEGCELMIGLNAEEADQRTGNHGLLPFVEYSYPLVDLGISREHCIKVLQEYGLEPDFPPYMQRGGCVGCFYKSKREYAAMALLAPDEFERVADMEEAIQDERGDFYAIRDGIPNMRRFGEAVRSQQRLFELDEMYPRAMKQTSCGVFCHR